MIRIQILDTNMWVTVLNVSELDAPYQMKMIKQRNPGNIVRAIDDNDRVVYSL